MAISDAARRNHDELFPDRTSALAHTDPELIEYFDNFAFGDVLADSDLDTRTPHPKSTAAITAPSTRIGIPRVACKTPNVIRVGVEAYLCPIQGGCISLFRMGICCWILS